MTRLSRRHREVAHDARFELVTSAFGCDTSSMQCEGIPECDEGDTEVEECPDNASCYDVEMCGVEKTCIDAGDPHVDGGT